MGGREIIINTDIIVPFINLQAKYAAHKDEIDLAVYDCIANANFINGPEVKIFQQELADFLAVKHVIGCANGTDALQIALMCLDLQPGDEIIIPAFGYVSPAEVATLLKFKPVFADVDPFTYNLDINKLEGYITKRTRAIIPIHLFGQGAEMEAIMAIANSYNIPVIEDTAQALGTSYHYSNGNQQHLGTIGQIGCTSFFPTKNLGCYGDGGALFTNDDNLAKKIKMIANHGQSEKYTYEQVGVNSRLDSLQAAILSVKLNYLQSENDHRKEIAAQYNQFFSTISEIIYPQKVSFSDHNYHQYSIVLPSKKIRNELKEYLAANHIASMIYYPKPLHVQQAFNPLGYKEKDFPVSELLCDTILALPIYPELIQQQIDHILSTISRFDFTKDE